MYPNSLTAAQYQIIAPFVEVPLNPKGGRPRKHEYVTLINAILYILKTGGQWRMLPNDFPAWQTVYTYFRKWKYNGTWKTMMDFLCDTVRVSVGKNAEPTAGIIDSRTNKASIKFKNIDVGYDAGKKIKGRKQHIIVDTLGLPIMVKVHSADIQDRDGAKPVLLQADKEVPTLKIIFADAGYAGKLVDWAKETFPWVLEIVKRSELHKFVILRKRWIVERTFSWLIDHRRIARDYEGDPKTSETMIHIAMISLMLRRLA